MDNLKPKMQRQMAILKDSPHANRERPTAAVALAKPDPAAFAAQPSNVFLSRAAMRADGAFRPKTRLDVSEGGFLVVEMKAAQNSVCHGVRSL
jgi:hypothetical protein